MTARIEGEMNGDGKQLVIYVAGPYSAASAKQISENVRRAELVGQEIMRRGHVALCPHTMTHDWDIGTGLEYQDFLRCDLELLRRCDAICMVEGWEMSKGSVGEWRDAQQCGLRMFMNVAEVPDLKAV